MKRHGFTLIELLVTLAAVSMLVAMLSGILWYALASGRDADSKRMVVAIGQTVQRRYDQFLERPLPVDLRVAITKINELDLAGRDLDPQRAEDLAIARLLVKREMMRMEMPERFSDILDPPVLLPARTSLNRYLYDVLTDPELDPTPEHQSAECLYLLGQRDFTGAPDLWVKLEGQQRDVLHPKYAEEGKVFDAAERTDLDGDKLWEWRDGWGQPIRFLRWAPGFESDLQHYAPPGGDGGYAKPHDPFDPLIVDPDAVLMIPLVYSVGPDGKSGLWESPALRYSEHANDPLASSATGKLSGTPTGEGHFDNVHSHDANTQ